MQKRSNAYEKLSYATKNATLFTKEGYTYPALLSYVNEGPANLVSLNQDLIWLPPGFRFWSTYSYNEFSDVKSYFKVSGRIAQDTHPNILEIAGYGDIDLQNIDETDLEFPIVNNMTEIKAIGHIVELPRYEIRLTIEGIEKKPLAFDKKGTTSDLFIVSVLQENLDAGYETKIPFFTIGINDEGVIGSLPLTTQNKLDECTLFPTLGPSQTARVTGCTVLPTGSENVKIILAIKTGAEYQFVVIDSGY